MKKTTHLVALLLISSCSWGQSQVQTEKKEETATLNTGNATSGSTSNQVPDEGTNDPTTTGSTKSVVNGVNYYYKENASISILFVEEKK